MTTAFGLLLPTREAVMNAANAPDFRRIFDLAERAEAQGFDSVWVGDSILSRPRFEPMTTLAAIAGRTSRVKLGTAVLVPIMRNPVVLANEVANVDVVSGGRLILGLGVGGAAPSNVDEMTNVGRPFEHRGARFTEEVTLMSRLWAGEEVTVQSRHVGVDRVRLGFLPVQRPRPPLWFGGNVESTFKRVARLGDGWFPNATSPEVVSHGWERIVALATEAGRDPTSLHRAVYLTLVIDDDPKRADQQMAGFMEAYYGRAYEAVARTSGLCAGDPEACAAFVNGFIDVGVQTIVVRFGSADQSTQLGRWTHEVRPMIKAV